MNFDEACKTARRIIRRSGWKRFKELTGLKRQLRCSLTPRQRRLHLHKGIRPWPLSERERDRMADHIHRRVRRQLQPELLQWRDEEVALYIYAMEGRRGRNYIYIYICNAGTKRSQLHPNGIVTLTLILPRANDARVSSLP